MNSVHLIFPHQLFKTSPLLEVASPIYLVEEFLFFKQYSFHKQKLAFHRATMKGYEEFLKSKNLEVHYIDATSEISDIRKLIPKLRLKGFTYINYIDPVDNWLQTRIENSCEENEMTRTVFDSPLFLNTKEELSAFFRNDKKKYYQTSFYKEQRKKRNILIEADGKPSGGKWTFDTENRKK
ncbi:MAG: cryptochrome/photolyase family protein [Maribacter sp.]